MKDAVVAKRTGSAATALTILALFAPGGLHAQNSGVTPAAVAAGSDRAAALHAEATLLFAQPARYREAAGLLVQAAGLRAATDAAAPTELINAGRLYWYAGDRALAHETLTSGGERALATGLVVEAAHAWLDAAFIASELGHTDAVRTLVRRAARVAEADYLDPSIREGILLRIRSDRVAMNTR